jgi:CRISPR-associated protein Cas2
MRSLLFFDLPTLTATNRKNYRKFVKLLKRNGFYMLQESVYCKMSIDKQSADATLAKLKKEIPSDGNIMMLIVTEKQFASMNILLGESTSDVLSSTDRVIEL